MIYVDLFIGFLKVGLFAFGGAYGAIPLIRDVVLSYGWIEDEMLTYIHPASAGHGLNIQSGGHILIWFGLTWSLELYQQTNARLWRQGQKETVTIHHIVTKDTVDEDVLAALASKNVTQEKLIAAVRARL